MPTIICPASVVVPSAHVIAQKGDVAILDVSDVRNLPEEAHILDRRYEALVFFEGDDGDIVALYSDVTHESLLGVEIGASHEEFHFIVHRVFTTSVLDCVLSYDAGSFLTRAAAARVYDANDYIHIATVSCEEMSILPRQARAAGRRFLGLD